MIGLQAFFMRLGQNLKEACVLEDLLLGFRLEVFTRRAKRELATHPRLYFFDTGFFVSIVHRVRSILPANSTAEWDG